MSTQDSGRRGKARPGDEPPAALVRTELDRILASELFTRSARLSSFLSFIVDRTLDGQGDSLKEQVIAVELYGKSADFSTADDPIVRIDARRLGDRLREYYAGMSDCGVIISVPKGSYTPVFRTTTADVAGPSGSIASSGRPVLASDVLVPGASSPAPTRAGNAVSRRWLIGGVVVVLIAALMWGVKSRTDDGSEPARLLIVTSLPGTEEDPSLSPDGRFVTFSWGGPSLDANHDIWIKSVDGERCET